MRKNLLAISLATFMILAGVAMAHSYQQGNIRIGHLWARAMPQGTTTAAIYFPILNTGITADTLIGASSPQATQIQIHDNMVDQGISRMASMNAVPLEPGKPVSFQPGSLHLMAIGLKQVLKEGDMFPLVLQFEKAGEAHVEVMVENQFVTPQRDH